MSLEKIIERILAEARVEADRIIEESRVNADALREQAQVEGKEHAGALLVEADRIGKLEASRLITQARLERRIRILSCKKELIEEVLDRAFQKENLADRGLKQKVVMKDGEEEVSFDQEKLKQELRPRLEKDIAEVLKL
jgi:vacuolar-type H+-ATPase subunit E/Vma4